MEITRPRRFSEASIEALGHGGAAVSRHFDEQIKDDWVNEDHILYPEQMAKLIDVHRHSVSLFVSPARGYDTVIGTRWSHSDLIQHIIDNSSKEKLGASNPFAYEVTLRSAIENGKPIFPINGLGEDEFTQEHLDAILEDQGPYIFSCQYLNQPVHEDAHSFLPEWNRFYTTAPPGLQCYTAIDPATARGDSSSAIVTIGAHMDRTLFVLETTKGNFSVDELVEEIIRHRMRYKGRVGMETVAFQKVLMHPIREAMRRYGISFSVENLHPIGNAKKEFRVAGILQPLFANGSILLREDMKDLIKELAWFPALKNYDTLDALSYAAQMARFPSMGAAQEVRDPFNIDVILKELEEKASFAGVKEPWMWNRADDHNPNWLQQIDQDRIMRKMIAPPLNKSEGEAWKIIREGAERRGL